MAITEGRFNKLEARVTDVSERVARFEGANGTPQTKPKWHAWLPVGAPVATLIVVVVTLGTYLDNKIGASQKEIQGIVIRLGKLEDAIKVLGNQQSDQTQKLIHDLLSAARTANNPTLAGKATQVAASLIRTLRDAKRPAPAEFFQSSIELLNQSGLKAAKADVPIRAALAEYRSAVAPQPTLPAGRAELPHNVQTGLTLAAAVYPIHATISFMAARTFTIDGAGSALDATGMRPDQQIILVATRSLENNPVILRNVILVGATQTLDYVTWDDVTFVNMHIRYDGGPLRLRNVRFINCTFDLPSTDVGARIADYAALQSTQELRLG